MSDDAGRAAFAFDRWLEHVFAHPVAKPHWCFAPDAAEWTAPPALTIAHITRLFRDPLAFISHYSDGQLNQGLWYLVSASGSEQMFALTDASIPLRERLDCLLSFHSLFEKLFAPRCSDHLLHLSPPDANPLNACCYMWWDIIPVFGAPNDPARAVFDDTALSVMKTILSLPSTACRESALHGLAHWQLYYPDRVRQIIDDARRDANGWSPELTAYAESARIGRVL